MPLSLQRRQPAPPIEPPRALHYLGGSNGTTGAIVLRESDRFAPIENAAKETAWQT